MFSLPKRQLGQSPVTLGTPLASVLLGSKQLLVRNIQLVFQN